MRILVTGASGFVGKHLLPELTQNGHEVAGASLGQGGQGGHGDETPGHYDLDVADAEAVTRVVHDFSPEAIIHLAAQASIPISWEDPAATYKSNIIGASNVLEAVKDRPGCRVLLIGTGHLYRPVDGEHAYQEHDELMPVSPYGVSKVAQEMLGLVYHRQFGLDVMWTRSFNHMGPGQGPHYSVGAFCSRIVAMQKGQTDDVLKVGYLGALRDFLDVRDVVRAYRLLIESGRGGEAYNVCSGRPVTVRQMLDMLLDIAGLKGKVSVDEDPNPRAGDPLMSIGDPAKIKRDVGWEPAIPLETSLSDTLDWYRSLTDVAAE